MIEYRTTQFPIGLNRTHREAKSTKFAKAMDVAQETYCEVMTNYLGRGHDVLFVQMLAERQALSMLSFHYGNDLVDMEICYGDYG